MSITQIVHNIVAYSDLSNGSLIAKAYVGALPNYSKGEEVWFNIGAEGGPGAWVVESTSHYVDLKNGEYTLEVGLRDAFEKKDNG